MRGVWGEFILCPMCISGSISTECQIECVIGSSGFPSKRTNLSPFTKDFRGGEHREMQTATKEGLTVVRELTVLRGLRAINKESLVALSI